MNYNWNLYSVIMYNCIGIDITVLSYLKNIYHGIYAVHIMFSFFFLCGYCYIKIPLHVQTRGALQLSQYSNNVEILKDVGIVFLHIESRKNSTLTAVLVYLILLKSTTDFEKNIV